MCFLKILIQVKIFPNFPFLRLFRNVLFYFHIFRDLSDLFLLLISSVISFAVGECTWLISFFSHFGGLLLRPRRSILVNVPYRLEKNGYSDVAGWSVYMSDKLSSLLTFLRSSNLLIFFLLILSVPDRRLSKS